VLRQHGTHPLFRIERPQPGEHEIAGDEATQANKPTGQCLAQGGLLQDGAICSVEAPAMIATGKAITLVTPEAHRETQVGTGVFIDAWLATVPDDNQLPSQGLDRYEPPPTQLPMGD